MNESTVESPLERFVLCVDDDLEFLKSLEVFLPRRINADRSNGLWYRFVFLQDPAETLEVLRELVSEGSTVAMLISDQQMPSMKGTELLSESRRIADSTLRVLLTGHAGIEAAITAINDRLLDRYLTKPIEDEHEFTLNVQQLLQRFEMKQVIDAQASALKDLYEFANTINAMDRLDHMVDYVARFTGAALQSTEVCVAAGEGPGECRGVAIGGLGRRQEPDPDVLVALVGDQRSEDGKPIKGAREVPGAWRPILREQGLELGSSGVCAGLISGPSCLGIIVAARDGRAFTEPERRTLEYIADTASVAIHKQLTWSELQKAYGLTKEQAASLEEANRRLTTLDEMKTEFLRFISHELRTPLSLMSAIGMIDGSLGPAEQAEMVAIIRRGYDRLERFIFKGLDYLDWCGGSRIKSDEVTDLRTLVLGAVERLTTATDREVELKVATPDGACPIAMSGEHADEIVRILLENSVKFSGDKPQLNVELRSSEGRVTLEIADRGRGFPPELARDIFQPFTVMDTRHHREGTALNLARAAVMIEAHGGRIHAESAGKGRGATFTIELPVASRGADASKRADRGPSQGEEGDGAGRRAA